MFHCGNSIGEDPKTRPLFPYKVIVYPLVMVCAFCTETNQKNKIMIDSYLYRLEIHFSARDGSLIFFLLVGCKYLYVSYRKFPKYCPDSN